MQAIPRKAMASGLQGICARKQGFAAMICPDKPAFIQAPARDIGLAGPGDVLQAALPGYTHTVPHKPPACPWMTFQGKVRPEGQKAYRQVGIYIRKELG